MTASTVLCFTIEFLLPNGALYTELLKQGRLYQDINVELSRRLAEEQNCKARQCYANCQRIVLNLRPYAYCDGFLYDDDFSIPVNHAWLLDSEGRIVDPTRALQNDFGEERRSAEYFGMEVDRELLREISNFKGRWDWVLNEVLFPEWFERQKKTVEKHGRNVVVIGEV